MCRVIRAAGLVLPVSWSQGKWYCFLDDSVIITLHILEVLSVYLGVHYPNVNVFFSFVII